MYTQQVDRGDTPQVGMLVYENWFESRRQSPTFEKTWRDSVPKAMLHITLRMYLLHKQDFHCGQNSSDAPQAGNFCIEGGPSLQIHLRESGINPLSFAGHEASNHFCHLARWCVVIVEKKISPRAYPRRVPAYLKIIVHLQEHVYVNLTSCKCSIPTSHRGA